MGVDAVGRKETDLLDSAGEMDGEPYVMVS